MNQKQLKDGKMKRSEMIEILSTYLEEVCYQDYVPDCEGIIKKLEEAGMSPPLLHPIHHYHLDQIQALDKAFRKWEEE